MQGRADPLHVVLVGFGRAGRIHARAMQALPACRLIAIVETSDELRALAAQAHPHVMTAESLEIALQRTGGDVVVDLCVPAPENKALCRTAIGHGVDRFMLEKPIGWTLSAAREVEETLRGRSAVYQDTYRFSQGVEMLYQAIASERSAIRRIDIRFAKNRKQDSLSARGFHVQAHPDAWHIEGPHIVSIAERMAGEVIAVEEARLYDMHTESGIFPDHGGGDAVLRHGGGVRARVSVDLCSDSNERIVIVSLENGISFLLRLPPSQSPEQLSILERHVDGRVTTSRTVEDRPMEQCVGACIEHFGSGEGGAPPISRGIAINATLERILVLARVHAAARVTSKEAV
jgi:predicted dehydrogenase